MKKEEINYPYLEEPVKIYTLENGHKIVIAKKTGKMANISSWVKTGSINENSKNNGVSHFLEHLMFKGTHKFKAGEFDRILERKGGIINAATWKDYTFYYVTIAVDSLDLAIKMHADMMIDPILPEDEIGEAFDVNGEIPEQKRERYVVIEEIKMREDESWNKTYNAANNLMYENHPYKRDVIGTPEIISRISRDEIMAYYKEFYKPDNITTIVVGDFNEDEILNKVIENFKFQDTSPVKLVETTPEIKIKEQKYTEKTADIKTGYAMFGFLAPCASNLKTNIGLDLVSTILGDGKSSRFNVKFIENVQEPHYYCISTCHYQFRDGDNFFIQANFDPKFKDTVIQELKDELKNLSKITENELKKAKKRAKVQFAQDSETVSDIADNIGYYISVCGDLRAASHYEEILDTIDVEYLQNLAQEYLNENVCAISVLMPNEDKE